MGYNAGGYGSMTFPDAAAIARWKKATVAHDAYDDWLEVLELSSRPAETVAKRLAWLAKGHDPRSLALQTLAFDGTRATLTFDANEDWFREIAADVAALVRSADAFGAKGTFYFLGTAGAEGDFAWEVALDGKRSKVAEVPRNRRMKVAYGKDYDAFNARVTAMAEAGNPVIRKVMKSFRDGEATTRTGKKANHAVAECLAKFSDEALARAVARYPQLVPGGTGLEAAKAVYRPSTVRAQLSAPPNEETRAAALWTLGQLAPAMALPLAFDVVARSDAENDYVVGAALRVLARASSDDDAAKALDAAVTHLSERRSPAVWSGAQSVLLASKHESLDKRLAALLGKVKADRGVYVVVVLQKRKRTALVEALAAYAKRTHDGVAAQLLAQWTKTRTKK